MAKGSCNYYRIGEWVDIIVGEADPVRWAFKNMVSSLTVCVLAAQSCSTFCNPMDYSPLGSSVHETLQATILEWVTISFCRGSSRPRNGTRVSCIAGRFFTIRATREAHNWLWRKKANSHVVSYLQRRVGVSRSWEWPTASKKTSPQSYNNVERNLPATRMNLEKDLPGENCKLSWQLDYSLLSLSWGSSDTVQTPHPQTLRE